jgi:hypothetical protein
MILADTSIWINHFNGSERQLQSLLDEGGVLMHPVVIGELACGTLPRRKQTLTELQSLPTVAPIASAEETMFVIESRNLWEKRNWLGGCPTGGLGASVGLQVMDGRQAPPPGCLGITHRK